MREDALLEENRRSLAQRPWTREGYTYRPVSPHDAELHRLKRAHPYFGYVEVHVQGVPPFLMMSNNDDVVAQVYFWFGPDAYEALSLRIWRELAARATTVVDVGAYTGLFTLVACAVNREAAVHALEPSPGVFSRLTMNLAVNRLGRRVNAHAVGASDENGRATLHGYQGHLSLSTGSSLAPKAGKRVEWSTDVPVRRLDALVDAQDEVVVKVDAEEMEAHVLRGMTDWVRASSPGLLVEVADFDMLERCRASLPGYTYAVIDDVNHRAMVEDPSLLVDRGRALAGEDMGRRIDVPNVVFLRATPDELRQFVTPLEQEPGLTHR